VLQAHGGAASAWPGAAVHDTVAAIARAHAYDRSLRTSIMQRLLGWIGDLFERLVGAVAALPYARWWVIGAGALVVLLIIARVATGVRVRARRASVEASRASDARDPRAEAERLAREGRYADAAHALYRALLEALARREAIRLHSSKTSGDYARELRARGSAAADAFRRFARAYDRLLFGHGEVDAAAYEALRDHASRLLA
jgi:hypothetical protein